MRRISKSMRGYLVFGLLFGTMAYAIAEDITLTTYYPSPRGVYDELRANAGQFGSVTVISPSGDLTVNGNTTLGDAAGDTLTFNASTLAIPNHLNIDTGTLAIDATTNSVAIDSGSASPTATFQLKRTTPGIIARVTADAADMQQLNLLLGTLLGNPQWSIKTTPTVPMFDVADTLNGPVTVNLRGKLSIRGPGITATTSGLHVMNSANLTTLFVRDDGRVGIGTTTPLANLDLGAGSLRLGGIARTTWPQLHTTAISGNVAAGNGWLYSYAGCPVGYLLTGCSGYFNYRCWGSASCDYLGAYPSTLGNGCHAVAEGYNGNSRVQAYAYCQSY